MSDEIPDVDIRERTCNAWMDLYQTHLRDHFPETRDQRQSELQNVRQTWPSWEEW